MPLQGARPGVKDGERADPRAEEALVPSERGNRVEGRP
jgi:hypothetical protein